MLYGDGRTRYTYDRRARVALHVRERCERVRTGELSPAYANAKNRATRAGESQCQRQKIVLTKAHSQKRTRHLRAYANASRSLAIPHPLANALASQTRCSTFCRSFVR